MNIEINEAVLQRLASDIDLDLSLLAPITITRRPAGETALAVYQPWRRAVVIYTSTGSAAENSRLRFYVGGLNNSVLHELRHAWQHQHWGENAFADTGPYLLRKHEVDARDFAARKSGSYRVVKVSGVGGKRSPLSRLGAAESRVRRAQ